MRRALILGGAANVMADADAALALFTPDLVVAANDIGTIWPGPIDFWVTLHPAKMARWADARRAAGWPDGFRTVTFPFEEHPSSTVADRQAFDRILPYRWEEMAHSGSSALYAVKVAFDLGGADRQVLAGVPLDPDRERLFADASRPRRRGEKPWAPALTYREGWTDVLPRLLGRVRSMSGWTAEILGRPTPAWLGT